MKIIRSGLAFGALAFVCCGPAGSAEETGSSTGEPSTGEPGTPTSTSGPDPSSTTGTSNETSTTTPDPTSNPTSGPDPTTSGSTEPDPTTSTTTTTTGDDTTTTTGDDSSSGGDDSTTGPVQMFTPLALEVSDFDGDEKADLLVLGVDNFDGVAGRISLGMGDGTFAVGTNPGVLGTSAFPVVGRLDPQPGTDVMVAQDGGGVQVFRWAVDGFEPWKLFSNANVPRTHVVHDVDEDGNDDIVWLWWTKNSLEFGLSIRPNAGNGFFAPVDTKIGVIAELGLAATSLLVGDINGDAVADALVFEADAKKGVLRLFGTPAGFFGGPKFLLPTLRPNVATLGDFDEDGALDILAFEHDPGRIVLCRGDGKGGFLIATTIDVVAPFQPSTFAIADLDADGHLDAAVVDVASPELRIWSGDGKGGFAAPASIALPSPAVRVHAAELDGDAPLELVAATFAAGDVTVLLDP